MARERIEATVPFVAGMSSVRLVQEVGFGLLLAPGETEADSSGSNALVSGVLLALAMFLYATAARRALDDEDADAPPKWITMTETMSPGRAFLVGAGVLDATAGWLKEKNGAIVIVVGVVFGTWFLVKGLSGLGVI